MLVAFLFSLVIAAPAAAQTALDGFAPNLDSQVFAVALQADGKILVGGQFALIAGQWRPGLARLNVDGSVDTTFAPAPDGWVDSLLVLPDGKILVGGHFTAIAGQPRNHLARLNADGSLDATFTADANDTVSLLVRQPDGAIVLAGDFTSVSGTARTFLARLRPDGSVDPAFDPQPDNAVHGVVVQPDGGLVIVGEFYEVHGQTQPFIARLRADGTLDPASQTAVNGIVYAAALQPDRKVVIGGAFSYVNSQARQGLARLNADGSLDSGFAPGVTGDVQSLVVQPDGDIVIAGSFTDVGGQPRQNIARVRHDGSLDAQLNPGADWMSRVLVIQGDGKILAGGGFNTLGGQTRPYLGRLYPDGSLDATITQSFNDTVHTTVVQPDQSIVLGGFFTGVGGQRLARLRPDGAVDATFDPDASYHVYALAVNPDGTILVGGSFEGVDNYGSCLVRLTAAGEIDPAFNGVVNNTVYAVVVQPDGRIVIGGEFTEVNGVPRPYLARLNADGSLDTSFDPGTGPDAIVRTIALQPDGRVLIGGDFYSVDGESRSSIARLKADGSLDAGLAAIDGMVTTIALDRDGRILVGGDFMTVGGEILLFLARLNADGSVDSGFKPSPNAVVRSIALLRDGSMIIGGEFFGVNGQTRNRLAHVMPNGHVDPNFVANTDGTVESVALQSDGKLLVGGTFATIAGQARANFARLAMPVAAQSRIVLTMDATTVDWLRSGFTPELERVWFETSTDRIAWTPLATPQPSVNGWTLSGVVLPRNQTFWLRARGSYSGGLSGEGSSLTESVQQFYLATHSVTSTVNGSGGVISPASTQTVVEGDTRAFTVTPDSGYHVDMVISGCGGALVGATFTTVPIFADCTVTATFALNTYTVTSTAGAHGAIAPAGSQTVDYGDTRAFTVTPDPGYYIHTVTGCGGLLVGTTFTTASIVADCTVTATFATKTISGYVYVDLDGNGARTGGEPGIGGVAMTLAGTDDLASPVSATTTTAVDGSYTFAGLRPGTYGVTERQPATHKDGPESIGTPASGSLTGTDTIASIVLPGGATTNAVGYNFGELPNAELSISHFDAKPTVLPGAMISHLLYLTNAGPGTAPGAVLTDVLPEGLTFVSISTTYPNWTCTTPPFGQSGTISCSTSSPFPPSAGDPVQFLVTAKTSDGLVPHSKVRHVAMIASSTAGDLNPHDNITELETAIAAPGDADLGVRLSVSQPPTVPVGSTTTFLILVDNYGPAASDATVTVSLPSNLTFAGTGGTPFSCTYTTQLRCELSGLAVGASAAISVDVTASASGRGTISVAVSGSAPDPNASNDQIARELTARNPSEADLSVTTTGPLMAVRGQLFAYTHVVKNAGPLSANNTALFVSLSQPGLTFLENSGDCTSAFTCSLGSMVSGQSKTVVSTYAVDAAYAGANPIVAEATVLSTRSDSDVMNNASSVPVRVVDPGTVNLRAIVVGSTDTMIAGTQGGYVLAVTNQGPIPATGVTLTATLPAGMSLVSSTATQGSCSGSTSATCTIGTLADGATALVTLVVETPSALPTPNPVSVSVSASANEPEGDASDNSASQSTTLVAQAELTITKTSAATVTAGTSLIYTITVTHDGGPSTAGNVIVGNPTPSGLTFTSNTGACTTAFPCSLSALAPGDTRTITATYAVPASYTSPASISTTARVTSNATETNTADNFSTPSTTVQFRTDLSIDVTGSATASPGGSASYTLTVTNNGPSDATGVQVANPTPSGLTFRSASGDCTTAFPCVLGAMASGATRTIVATFDVASSYTTPDPIVDTATVSATTTDPNAANDSDSATTALGPGSADLSVTMTGPATATSGLPVSFEITVHNNGPSDAGSVTLSDVTPTGLTFMSTSGDCWTTFPCALGTIPAGGSKVVTAAFNVPSLYTTPDPIVNTATVSSLTTDPVSTNDTASANVTVGTDVSVTMTASPDPVPAGGDLTFTIVATNGGASDATDLAITNTLPAGTTFVSASSDAASCSTPAVGAAGTVVCTWSGVTASAASRTLTLVVRVDPGTASGATIANTASASSLTNDPNSANNSAVTSTTVTTEADITLTKQVDNPTPNVGDVATFTVTVHNAGPSHATGVAVTDALPLGLTLVDATPSQGDYEGTSGLWTVGALSNGASATLQVRATVMTNGAVTNTATKTAGDQLDPNTSNNSAAAMLTSNPAADVRVQTTVDKSSANVGDTVTFTITVSNAGPSDATGLRLVDLLPPTLTFVDATASSGSYDSSNGLWTLGDLALHAEASLVLKAIVNDGGPIVNEASKTLQGEHDPNPANDTSAVTVNGLAADIQVVTTLATTSSVRVGEEVVFFVTTTNNGPSAATGVRVRDLLPKGLAYRSSSATRGIYVPQTGVWDLGALDATGPGATATLELHTILLSPSAVANRASVMSVDQPDLNRSNDTSTVAPPMVASELDAKITTTSDTGLVGSTADFVFDVTNSGDGNSISPVTVAVPLPQEYSYVGVAAAVAAQVNVGDSAPDWSCTLVGSTVFCRSLATLAPGQHMSLTLHLKINATPAPGTSLFAYLTTPSGGEGVPADVTQIAVGGAGAQTDADLAVRQTVTVSGTGTGTTRTLTFAIDVANQGAIAAEQVRLSDVLQAGLTFVSATGPLGACAQTSGYLTCDLGTIAPGDEARATVVVTATAPGGVIHSVGVSSRLHDPDLDDNYAVLTQRLELADDTDTDGDGMPDVWESLMGLSVSTADANGDPDGDGVSNLAEYQRGTHPRGTEHRYFAEGASNDFFTTTLAVLNPDASAYASVMIELLQADGTVVSAPRLLAPMGRLELDPRTLMAAGGTFSVLVESDHPIAVERDMRWDASGYGSTGETGTPSASESWYFAEGATGPYSLFYLIENPSMTQAADLKVTFLLPDGRPPVVHTDTLAPHSRTTLFVNDLAKTLYPSLRGAELAATVESTNGVPIVAERAMYQNVTNQPMGAGHAGLGATSPSASWFFAEGATGAFFNEYLLLANPQATATMATVRYLLPDGSSFEKPYELKPMARRTIDVAGEDERLRATAVSAMVTATQPIVAERVMWWPGRKTSPEWYEAHVSLGATSTGIAWAIAGGAAGGRWAEQTYALVANQEPTAGQVRVTVTFDDGAPVTRTVDLAATSRTTIDFAGEFPETRGQHFSALLESIGDTPVPIVVEWSRYGSPAGQFWGAGSAALATKVR